MSPSFLNNFFPKNSYLKKITATNEKHFVLKQYIGMSIAWTNVAETKNNQFKHR